MRKVPNTKIGNAEFSDKSDYTAWLECSFFQWGNVKVDTLRCEWGEDDAIWLCRKQASQEPGTEFCEQLWSGSVYIGRRTQGAVVGGGGWKSGILCWKWASCVLHWGADLSNWSGRCWAGGRGGHAKGKVWNLGWGLTETGKEGQVWISSFKQWLHWIFCQQGSSSGY